MLLPRSATLPVDPGHSYGRSRTFLEGLCASGATMRLYGNHNPSRERWPLRCPGKRRTCMGAPEHDKGGDVSESDISEVVGVPTKAAAGERNVEATLLISGELPPGATLSRLGDSQELLPGTRLEPYVLRSTIASGGGGYVYLA